MSTSLAARLRKHLEESWRDAFARDISSLAADLQALEKFFDPLKTGRSLREVLRALPTSTTNGLRDIPPDLVIEFRDGRRLITPEGRTALACLLEAERRGVEVVIHPDLVARAEHQLLVAYRQWAQKRLRSVVRLENAEGHVLHPLGLGLLLFLLINRSTARQSAVVLPPDDERGRRLDEAIARILESFADVIRPSTRGRRATVRSGYPITEARRLSQVLAPDRDSLYLLPDSEERAIDYIGAELRRRDLGAEAVSAAFDKLVSEYRSQLPVLAAFGVAHERATWTQRLRRRLLDRLAP
jgi:hypothetical protein